ncbi:unnamed protein product [Rhizoctonia solani]|uniref:Uncharacterized protein n=1 Tax=Rhizoctonia solani TaxID=456999 RepID=A0A8H3G8V6_9AGAM|nr:unnamed protein product [Rhizoctonia solani]
MSLANSTFTPNRTALLDSTPALIPGLRSYVAQTYSAGSSFSLGNITTFSDLSEFCRFGAQYNTSTNSQIQLRFGCRRPIIGMDGLLMLGMVGILALSHTRLVSTKVVF